MSACADVTSVLCDKKMKIVLAYSGGLDTTAIIPWLKENYGDPEIVAVSGNVGQADELEGLEEKALKTGASKLYVLDLTDAYVDNYIIPTMKAGALYEEYLLGTSHARPCIAKRLVETSKSHADFSTYYDVDLECPAPVASVKTTSHSVVASVGIRF